MWRVNYFNLTLSKVIPIHNIYIGFHIRLLLEHSPDPVDLI